MAYTPTTWAAGDTVTAAKMNNIETGLTIATPVTCSFNESTKKLNTKGLDIVHAIDQGKLVYVQRVVQDTAYTTAMRLDPIVFWGLTQSNTLQFDTMNGDVHESAWTGYPELKALQ